MPAGRVVKALLSKKLNCDAGGGAAVVGDGGGAAAFFLWLDESCIDVRVPGICMGIRWRTIQDTMSRSYYRLFSAPSPA